MCVFLDSAIIGLDGNGKLHRYALSRPLISRLLRHRKLAKRLTRGRRKTNCWRIKFSNSGIEDYRTHAHDDPWPLLERKPDRDFDIAWTATTYIRVLSAHIGSNRKRQVP